MIKMNNIIGRWLSLFSRNNCSQLLLEQKKKSCGTSPINYDTLKRGYAFSIGRNREVLALVAGDQCWERTGIVLDEEETGEEENLTHIITLLQKQVDELWPVALALSNMKKPESDNNVGRAVTSMRRTIELLKIIEKPFSQDGETQ